MLYLVSGLTDAVVIMTGPGNLELDDDSDEYTRVSALEKLKSS